MPVTAIGGISLPTAASLNPTTSIGAAKPAAVTDVADNPVGNLFTDTLQNTIQAQGQADTLMTQAATGQLGDLTSAMTAMTEAQLATQLTAAVRNKAVESFNEVMRMQI
jgi:flagellar hook-basal body complex protein FliE